MIKSYLKITWRNLIRNKVNSLLNISGLAIGIACVLFITLYIADELKFDRFLKNVNHIYQVDLDGNFGGQQFLTSNTPPTVGVALHTEFPEIEAYTRIYRTGNEVIHSVSPALSQRSFTEKNLWAVDSGFLNVFSFPLKEGDRRTCLLNSHSIVITELVAHKYFGKSQAVGQSLVLDEYKEPFIVTGVLKDIPAQSSLQFDLLIPVMDCPPVQRFSWSWIWCQMSTYVVLNNRITNYEAGVRILEAKFPAMVKKLAASAFNRVGQPYDEFLRKGGKWDFKLKPFATVHLYSADMGTPLTNLGSIKYVYIFSAIGLFIIILACVNFMNLSTAQAVRRAKEVGIRKVLGSLRSQMIRQFLAEALFYAVIAMIIALLLVSLLIPSFNLVSGKSLHFGELFRNHIWLFLLLLCTLTGLMAGSYPAFYLTSFQPVAVLKGNIPISKNSGKLFIRNGLVIFQFTVSIALIICTIVVFKQLQYTRNKDLGLKKDNVLIIPNIEKLAGNMAETYRQELGQLPGITHASVSSGVPANDFSDFSDFYVPVKNGVTEPLAKDITLSSFVCDENLIPALHIQLIKGRNFSKSFSDSSSVIVNEETVRQVGWKEPVGKQIRYPGNNDQTFTVIGVARDFNLQSLYNTVMPFALFHESSKTYHPKNTYLVAYAQTANMEMTLQQAENKWKVFAPGTPFEYSFLDKDYEALYRSEVRMGTVFGIFTLLSIVIACLGLFGLSVFTAERRTKEIGIRKVLGASVGNVVTLLSRDFLKLVFVSAIIAFPIAGWVMHKWLEDFAYRISMSVSIFVVAALLAIGIALITVSFQAIKAALANPARSLQAD